MYLYTGQSLLSRQFTVRNSKHLDSDIFCVAESYQCHENNGHNVGKIKARDGDKPRSRVRYITAASHRQYSEHTLSRDTYTSHEANEVRDSWNYHQAQLHRAHNLKHLTINMRSELQPKNSCNFFNH